MRRSLPLPVSPVTILPATIQMGIRGLRQLAHARNFVTESYSSYTLSYREAKEAHQLLDDAARTLIEAKADSAPLYQTVLYMYYVTNVKENN